MPSSNKAASAALADRRSLDEDDAFALASDVSGDSDGDDNNFDDDNFDDDHDDYDDAVPSERQGLVDRQSTTLVANDLHSSVRAGDSVPREPNLTIREAVRVYRKAILWCLLTSACVIMEGYDMILYVC